MKIYGIILALCMAALGCTKGVNTDSKTPLSFFDLKAYFKLEAERLNEDKTVVLKTIIYNDESEKKTISGTDFEEEFSIFIRSDINKIAWQDKYEIDSIFINQALKSLTYIAIDTSLRTRFLEINLDSIGGVERIVIENRLFSLLAKTKENLSYEASKGYRITTTQDNKTAEKSTILIEGKFEE